MRRDELQPFDLGDGVFVYDVFHCRRDYVGMVAPFYCRPAFDGISITINGTLAEWFTLPDSRQFTLSVLAKIPLQHRLSETPLLVQVGRVKCVVPRVQLKPRRLAMATMVRYDEGYLAEWLEFHHHLGFEHFYVYNHGSEPPITAICRKFAYVTEIPWRGDYGFDSAGHEPFLEHDSHCYTQCPQMMHAALKYGDHWDWMGFFDADEFLCPMAEGIPWFLNLAEQHCYGELPFVRPSALRIQGKWFGTSDHVRPPSGSVLTHYTHCERGHTSGTKCFVQPKEVTGSVIHHWDVNGQTAEIPDSVLRFNHYSDISPFKRTRRTVYDDDRTNATKDTRILGVRRQWTS